MRELIADKRLIISILLILAAFAVGFQKLAFYLHFDFNLLLSLLLVPFVLYVKHKGNYSIRFGIVSLVFLAFYPLLKVQSLYFFGFAFFILFVIETFIGRFNNLPVFLLVLLSPLAIFAIEVFGFPIRLWLTDAATHLISYVNNDMQSSGNQLFINGNKFSVDPECMGLKMVITGFLISLVIMNWFEKKTRREISFFKVIIIICITAILIIISNLLRIIGIVFAKAPPETTIHELIGIFSLIIYVILPVYFISKLFFKYFSKSIVEKASQPEKKYSKVLILMLLIFIGFLNLTRENYRTLASESKLNKFQLEDYKCSVLENKVIQYTNDDALVYIKTIPNFYSADHTPMICWKGSGYQLQNQQKLEIAGKEIYYAELTDAKKNTLFTAWWYSNGKHLTISQLNWRWRLIKGEDSFSLVNVTCESKEILNGVVKQFLMKIN